jgi:cathepsin L
MMKTLLFAALVACALIAVSASSHSAQPKQLGESEYQTHFTSFVKKFNKKYTHDEFFPRYTIFKANFNKIRHHNLNAKATFSMAVNEFADMTFTEFHSKMTGYKRIDKSVRRSKNGPHKSLKTLASSVDWRAKNAVTPVKNQQ